MCVFRVFQGAQQRIFCDIFLEYFSTSEKLISGADFLFLRHLEPSQKCVENCHISIAGRKVEHFLIFCVFSANIFQARVWVCFFNIHKNAKTHFKERKSRVAKCPKTRQKMVCFHKKHFCGRHWQRKLQILTQKMPFLRVSLFLTFFLIFVDLLIFFQKNHDFLMCKNVHISCFLIITCRNPPPTIVFENTHVSQIVSKKCQFCHKMIKIIFYDDKVLKSLSRNCA